MEFKFWKNKAELLILFPIMIVIIVGGFIAFLLLTIKNISFIPVLIIFTFSLFYILYFPFSKNSPFQKIIISDTSIKSNHFKKKTACIKWEEMSSIYLKVYINNTPIIIFESKNNIISMQPSKKLYKAILSVCPRQDLKDMLKNIEWFKRTYEIEDSIKKDKLT